MTHRKPAAPRNGFTLIELLVVITIIIVLAALAIAVAPRFSDSHKSALGASQVQGWLAIAKQRAYRDKVLRGVRLFRASTTPGDPDYDLVKEFAYIEQPDDLTTGTLNYTPTPPVPPATQPTSSNQVQIILPFDPSTNGAIQVGDFLEVPELVEPFNHRITGVAVTPGAPPSPGPPPTPQMYNVTLTLASPISLTNPYTTQRFRVIRQPRTLSGEVTMKLPADMAVWIPPPQAAPAPLMGSIPYIAPSLPPPAPTLPEYMDIVFRPTGGAQIRNPNTGAQRTEGKVILWVLDATKATPLEGEPTLIVVYTKTGFVAAHPVNIAAPVPPATLPDYYSFTKDGRSSGL